MRSGETGPITGYGFAASLAVRDAALAFGAAPDALHLKWPNDVLLGGGKLSGLLIESLDGTALALGIGVNLAAAPRIDAYPTAALAGNGRAPAPSAFLAALDEALTARVAQWRGHGFAALRTAWLSAARGLGAPLTVRLPKRTLKGVFEDLAPDGALRLRTPEGVQTITAGDVFFRDDGR